jgi:hypothetical protein
MGFALLLPQQHSQQQQQMLESLRQKRASAVRESLFLSGKG